MDGADRNRALFFLREAIIKRIANGAQFSDEEMAISMSFFCDLIIKNMPPTEQIVKTFINLGFPLTKYTFPQSVWNNDELVYYAMCTINRLPMFLAEKITEQQLIHYIGTHAQEDIERLEYSLKYNSNRKLQKLFSESSVRRIQKGYSEQIKDLVIKTNYFWEPIKFRAAYPDSYYDPEIDYAEFKDFSPGAGFELIAEQEYKKTNHKLSKEHLKRLQNPILFHYISDLHLTHKIKNLIDQGVAIEDAVKRIVKKAVKDIAYSLTEWKNAAGYVDEQPLLIGGDVSFDFDISKAFYTELVRSVGYGTNIITILGNHELWDGDEEGIKKHHRKRIIDKYRKMLNDLGITLLENQLLTVSAGIPCLIDSEELLDPDREEEIRQLVEKASYCIFGGLGYSGQSRSFNAENGIYRSTISTLREDKKCSSEFYKTYRREIDILRGKQLICFTHTPFTDWASGAYDANCIYIYGHTHTNYYDDIGDYCIYADNQIGYKRNTYRTKQFAVNAVYDTLKNYDDGIHQISNMDYTEFLHGLGLRYSYRIREDEKLYLLKKSGIYMFVAETKNGLCILSGGARKRLGKKPIDYYYDNLDAMSAATIEQFSGLNNALHQISDMIVSLGGEGRIHGTIVDIDYHNHVALNFIDRTIEIYSASSMYERYHFSSLGELLTQNLFDSPVVRRMERKYLSMKGDRYEIVSRNVFDIDDSVIFSSNTEIYSPSRAANKVQKLFDYNILQVWSEKALKQYLCSKKLLPSPEKTDQIM